MLAVLEPVRDILKARGASASWNLHLDKLSFRSNGGDDAKKQALDLVRRSYVDSRTKAHLIDACHRQQRFLDLLRTQHGDHYREVTLINSTRLLLHLGRASALENVGLASERSTGLPVIPGTSVKGIISTWACWEGNILPDGALPDIIAKRDQDRARFSSLAERILGSNAEKGSTAAGEIIFLGGFPAAPPKLVIDILTPHERGKPLPNSFLALDPGTPWVFPLLSRRKSSDVAKLLEQGEVWIIEALTQVGLGAKTAAGYGRFRTLATGEKVKLEAERSSIIAANAAKRNAAEKERARLAEEAVRRLAAEAIAKQKAEHIAMLSPEERAYAEYVDNISDWVPLARDIATKTEVERQHILRFFRTPEGQALWKSWTNDKGKKRIQNLKDAGL